MRPTPAGLRRKAAFKAGRDPKPGGKARPGMLAERPTAPAADAPQMSSASAGDGQWGVLQSRPEPLASQPETEAGEALSSSGHLSGWPRYAPSAGVPMSVAPAADDASMAVDRKPGPTPLDPDAAVQMSRLDADGDASALASGIESSDARVSLPEATVGLESEPGGEADSERFTELAGTGDGATRLDDQALALLDSEAMPMLGAAGELPSWSGRMRNPAAPTPQAPEPIAEPPPPLPPLPAAPTVRPPPLVEQWGAPARIAEAELGMSSDPASMRGDADAGPKPNAEATEHQRVEREARDKAMRAYAELAVAARRRQAQVLADSRTAIATVIQTHARVETGVRSALAQQLAEFDRHAGRQVDAIEQAALQTERELIDAHGAAVRRVAGAATGAEALIDVGDAAAIVAIAEESKALKDGHATRFRIATENEKTVFDAAIAGINAWVTHRAETYSIDGPFGGMMSAKRERWQGRAPVIGKRQQAVLTSEHDERIKAWTTKSTEGICKVGCSYEDALDDARIATYEAGRKAVRKARARARQQLDSALADARANLERQKQAARALLFQHQRGVRDQLSGQAQATLSNLRSGAEGSVGSLSSAASVAMPAYWQGLTGLRQTLVATASSGAAALRKLSAEAPREVLSGLDASASLGRLRLAGIVQRADASQHGQRDTLAATQAGHRRQGETAIAQGLDDAAQTQARLLAGFIAGTEAPVDSVASAGKPYAEAPRKLLESAFDKAGGKAKASLAQIFADSQGGGGQDGAPEGGCDHCGGPEGAQNMSSAGGEQKGIDSQLDLLAKTLGDYESAESQPDIVAALDAAAEGLPGEAQEIGNAAITALTAGTANTVDEAAVSAALRVLTPGLARAVNEKDYDRPAGKLPLLEDDLAACMNVKDDDFLAAQSYLHGRPRDGAKHELAASEGIIDDEARIEDAVRALSPNDAHAIGADPDIGPRIRDALGDDDLAVFKAFTDKDGGGAARADAIRLKAAVQTAQGQGKSDEVHDAIKKFSVMRGKDWNTRQLADMDPDERAAAAKAHRAAVGQELGKLVVASDPAQSAAADLAADEAGRGKLYESAAVAFVERGMVRHTYERDEEAIQDPRSGRPHYRRIELTAARDLASALLLHGEDSIEARVAMIGTEQQRFGDTRPDKLRAALHDDALLPDLPGASQAERQSNERAREAARRKKAEILVLAAQKYAGAERAPKDHKPDGKALNGAAPDDPVLADAQDRLIATFGKRFGRQYGKTEAAAIGTELVSGLIREDRPSPKTAALAMRFGMRADPGTKEALLSDFTASMTADEIAATDREYEERYGTRLEADLQDELSGDEWLQMERERGGLARTEKERIIAAAFAIHQQRRETGVVGKWLAEGSSAEQILANTEASLHETLGITTADVDIRGRLTGIDAQFDAAGRYVGTGDRGTLFAAVANSQAAAAGYSARIDRYANAATTGIAIIGAVAGAILSGGAATPLIAAAMASGLASMGANFVIKGGRYGWEQAGIDLGMTLVQAATAGLGQRLGMAAQLATKGAEAVKTATRTLQVLSRLFGTNAVKNQLIIGAITGTFGSSANLVGGLAGTAFSDETWSKSGLDIVSSLLFGLARGALSGGTNAGMTQALEAMGRRGAAAASAIDKASNGGRMVNALSRVGVGNGKLNTLAALGGRGLAKAGTAGIAGMAGRGVELALDAQTGRYKGRFDDALEDIALTGLQQAIQGFGEGGGEAINAARTAAIRTRMGELLNAERIARGYEPFDGPELSRAAEALHLLNVGGKEGRGRGARVDNFERIVEHGGFDARKVGDPDNGPSEQDLREQFELDLPPALKAALVDHPLRVADNDAPFRSPDGDPSLMAMPGVGRDQALLRVVDGALIVLLRPGIGMRAVARAGRGLAQAVADGSAQALIGRNAPDQPIAPRPGGTEAEQAIAADVPLLRVLGIGGERDQPGLARARQRIDAAVSGMLRRHRGEVPVGPLTGPATMRERLRSAWKKQAVFGPLGRTRLTVIGELALGDSPRMKALLGADGPAADAAARSLMADYGDARKLLAMLAIADSRLTPNLVAAAKALRASRERIIAGLAADFGASEAFSSLPLDGKPRRRGESIELEFLGEGGSARLARAREQLEETFGADWQQQLDFALVVRPADRKKDPRPVDSTRQLLKPDGSYDPDGVTLPQESRRTAADAGTADVAQASVSSPAALPAAAGHTRPAVQRSILDTLNDLRMVTVGLSKVAPARAMAMFERHKQRAIGLAAGSDPLAPDFGGNVVAARLKEAWAKQAVLGEPGLKRLAVIRELANPTSDRARDLLGHDPVKTDAAALSILKDYGSYEHLMAMLSAGGRELTPALQACAERVLDFRARVTKALHAGYGAYELGSASKFLNSDVDLSFSGSDAGARLLAAEARMAKAYGPDWEKLFTMNFYVGAERLTAFHDLPAAARSAAAADALTDHTLQAVIGRVLSDVHDSEVGRIEVGRMAGLLGVDVTQPAARPDLDRGSYKDKRRAALLAADKAVQDLKVAPPELQAALRLEIATLTMVANRYSTEAYIGPGAVLLTLGAGGKVTPDLALQSFVGDFENFIHKLYGHGKTVEGGLRDYTTFKYMGRMMEALRAGGVSDSRMAYFEGLAAYLYGGNREGGFESAHVFANPEIYGTGKGKAQLSDLPQDVGGTGAVDAAFLQADLGRFMDLINELAPRLRANNRALFSADGYTPPTKPTPPAAPGAQPSVIINLPGVSSRAAPAAAERPYGTLGDGEIVVEKAAAVARVAKLAALPEQIAAQAEAKSAAKGPATDPEVQAAATAARAEMTAEAARLSTDAGDVADLAAEPGRRPTPPKPQTPVSDAEKRHFVIRCFVAVGLDLAAIVRAQPHQFGNAFTAFGDDPMRASPAAQRTAAEWAMERARGDLSQFASYYEYAIQRYKRLRPAADDRDAEVLTPEGLQIALVADTLRLRSQPRAEALPHGTAGMSDRDIGLAVQRLERFAFADSVKEAYHALKHEREMFEGFSGDVFDRHLALAVDTIRNGKVMDAGSTPAGAHATRIVIHKQYDSADPKSWREAILFVRPDGKVTLASWGDCKAVRRNEKTGEVKEKGGKGRAGGAGGKAGAGAPDVSLGARSAAGQTDEASRERKKGNKQAPKLKAAPVAASSTEAQTQTRKQDQKAKSDQDAKDDQTAKQDRKKDKDRKKP